ncbi:MAG TPA: stage III sporulation protein AE [Tissierellia bacterium]|nr:stage III sporulation protein AE [Tissierellia bacterium]
MAINRKIIIFLLIFIFIHYKCAYAQVDNFKIVEDADMLDSFMREQLDSLNIRELELVLEDLKRGNEKYISSISIKEYILSILRGEASLDIKSVTKEVLKTMLDEVIDNLSLISQILVVTIGCSILTNLQTSFEEDSIAKLGHYACYIILSMMIINSFMMAIGLARDTVIRMVGFMEVLLPILLVLLTAVSGAGTRLLFHPVVIGTVNIIGNLIKSVVFPLILFTFIVGVISNISQKAQFSKLSELLRQVVAFILGGAFTIFVAIITIYGIGSNVDGITIRTAKFAVDNFIPIIGKFLSDAVETVVGGSAILKNGIGMIGLIALFLIILFPAVKILVLIFVYKLISALVQPIVADNITDCFEEVSKDLIMILVGIITVATMFFITITVIVEAGNSALMFR